MDFLQFYSRLSNRIVVNQIMTPTRRLQFVGQQARRADTLALLNGKGYDQTPIRSQANGDIKLIVRRSELEKADRGETVLEYSEPLGIENLVSDTTPIVSALDVLESRRFLYLLRKNRVVGLVTYADIDKRPSRVLLYALLGELEQRLITLMEESNADPNYWLAKLTSGQKNRVEGWHIRRTAQGMEVSIVECFSLEHIFAAIRDEPAILRMMGIEQNFQSFSASVWDLRDKLSHQGLDLIVDFEGYKSVFRDKESVLKVVRNLSGSEHQ